MIIEEVSAGRAEEAAWFLDNYYQEVKFSLSRNREKTVREIFNSIFNEYEQVLLAIENDIIIGIAWSHLQQPFFSDDWVVENIVVYVHPSKRGSMAGPRLMRHIKKWGESMGAKMVKIGTISEINTARTKNLYRKMGYREVGSHFITEL